MTSLVHVQDTLLGRWAAVVVAALLAPGESDIHNRRVQRAVDTTPLSASLRRYMRVATPARPLQNVCGTTMNTLGCIFAPRH